MEQPPPEYEAPPPKYEAPPPPPKYAAPPKYEAPSPPKYEAPPPEYLVNEILQKLDKLGPPLSSECCIYRVPEKLRKANESAYTPQIVSIGPLHHGKEYLQRMEKLKLRYLKNLLPDSASGDDKITLVLIDLVVYIKEKETNIRQCYAKSLDYFSSDEFVEMVLVDAAFIFELFFLRAAMGKPVADHELAKAWLQVDIEQDLILLENQIPFFILRDIYDFASQNRHWTSFDQLTKIYFSAYNTQNKEIPGDIKHFTDLLRYFLLPPCPPQASPIQRPPQASSSQRPPSPIQCSPQASPIQRQPQASPSQSCCPNCYKYSSKFLSSGNKLEADLTTGNIYSATKLYEGGVKFKARSSNCMLDIKFSNGYLEMPCFKLYHTTESFIRNIMALELCHYPDPDDAKICDYILLMDYLINTEKDVELLVQKKVMENWLGDHHEAATLFNKLRFQIPEMKNTYYSNLFDELNAYYKVPRHGWKATLKHEYFSSPWRGAATVAAVILLVLTAIQTVCSIISLL